MPLALEAQDEPWWLGLLGAVLESRRGSLHETLREAVNIYVLDTGVYPDHEEFRGPSGSRARLDFAVDASSGGRRVASVVLAPRLVLEVDPRICACESSVALLAPLLSYIRVEHANSLLPLPSMVRDKSLKWHAFVARASSCACLEPIL